MISIIVPIYNSEKWLEQCIQSIINQTLKDIEIILINDGSKDKSLEICQKYEKLDNRIVVVDKQNEGVSATRNLGLKIAKGEFIQFVDSDDYIEKSMCQKLLDAITNADMALCGLNVRQNKRLLRTPHLENGTYNLKDNIDIYFKLRKINLGPCNKLYRKSLITNNFREDLSLGEDTVFLLDYMKNINKICVISDLLYNVCLDNNNSLNRKSKADKIYSLIDQRMFEENFLTDLYGKNCDLTKMNTQYLMLLHSHFIGYDLSSKKELKNSINELINNNLLLDKAKNSNPDRFDYKIFKHLFIRKQKFLTYLYFILKILILK